VTRRDATAATERARPGHHQQGGSGLELDVTYPNFRVRLTLLSAAQLKFEIKDGHFARPETVDIHVVPLGYGIFVVSWQEKDGATVVNVQDYDRGLIHAFATLLSGRLLRMIGTVAVSRPADCLIATRRSCSMP